MGEQTEDACRNFELIFVIEKVQEHVDGDYVGLAWTQLGHQSTFHEVFVVSQDVISQEVMREGVLVTPQLIREVFVLRKYIGSIKLLRGRAIKDQLSEVLAHTRSQIEQRVSGFQAWEDEIVIEWVLS